MERDGMGWDGTTKGWAYWQVMQGSKWAALEDKLTRDASRRAAAVFAQNKWAGCRWNNPNARGARRSAQKETKETLAPRKEFRSNKLLSVESSTLQRCLGEKYNMHCR
jgi:hypothetical protein